MKPAASLRRCLVDFVRPLTPAAVLAAALGAGACATTAGSTAAQPITAPAQIAGTKWKLPMVQGKRDGRMIEFKKVEGVGYHAVLTRVGSQLGSVAGAYEGLVLMELAPNGSALTLTGLERIPGRELAEVNCSISESGSEMKCSNEDWVWLRDS